MQIVLHYPRGRGTGDAERRAALIRDILYRGSTFADGGISVMVEGVPRIARGMNDDDTQEWVLPIYVRFHADIFL
jgi:hypothetical protein